MILHVFLLTSRRFIRFISTSRFSTLLGFLNLNVRILKLEYIHASLQVQSCALHLSVGLGACSAALLLARWLQHIAWSISIYQLPFVPRQCLLQPRRGLLVEWFMLWIFCWLGTCIVLFLCIGLRFTSLTGSKTYRGACTVRDWSNTTACPVQWCNDSKGSFLGHFESLMDLLWMMTAAYSLLLLLVVTSSWANLWKCPPQIDPTQWWCGVNEQEVACQSVTDGHFNLYTPGSILGFPPLTSSTSAATATVTDLATPAFCAGPSSKTVTVPASSPAKRATVSPSSSSPVKTSTNPPLSAQTQEYSTSLPTDSSTISHTQEHSASLPIAIGVGIGVPLVITAIGFLGFLCWKEAGRQRIRESRWVSRESNNQSVTVPVARSWNELPDASLPRELDGIGRAELPNNN